jgi:N-lysine methyltransferase SETD6
VFCLAMMVDSLDEDGIPEMERTAELKDVVLRILGKRVADYDTSIEEDENLLQTELSLRGRMAVEVRLGEKRILNKAIERVEAWVTPPPTKRVKTN